MNDIMVRLIDMPTAAGGFTLPDANGDYNVYINARAGLPAQLQAYEHELRHIHNGDFDKPDAAAVETEAHGLS